MIGALKQNYEMVEVFEIPSQGCGTIIRFTCLFRRPFAIETLPLRNGVNNMSTGQTNEYLIIEGVEMKPGVRIYCTDRETMFYDLEGTIVSVTNKKSFGVSFDGPDGKSNSPEDLTHDQIWPTSEERDTPEAKQRRMGK
jgi:hypothetical protein